MFFPTAMHIAAARALHDDVLPALEQLRATSRASVTPSAT